MVATCPVHPDVAMVVMWEMDRDVEHRAAWRCDRCRRLYGLRNNGTWTEIPWPERDRRAYYQSKGVDPGAPPLTIIVPGASMRKGALVVPG